MKVSMFKVDNIYMIGSKLLQMVLKSILNFDVGVCLIPQSYGIKRGCCVYIGGEGCDCDIPHWIREKVPDTI